MSGRCSPGNERMNIWVVVHRGEGMETLLSAVGRRPGGVALSSDARAPSGWEVASSPANAGRRRSSVVLISHGGRAATTARSRAAGTFAVVVVNPPGNAALPGISPRRAMAAGSVDQADAP